MTYRAVYWCSVVAVLALILAVGSSERCENDKFRCIENDSCIPVDTMCDGKLDCPNGSDESFTVCKGQDPENQTTHCANGAQIPKSKFCDGVVDCLDGSDELPQICTNNTTWQSKYRGNCTLNEIQCLPGECVPKSKTCNNEIDCSNGLDESLEMCMQNCGEKCFRCGNGVLIEEERLCDNYMHCLDGTDELPSVCDGRKNWSRVQPKICFEPTDRKFTTKTKFTVKDSKRFVYANQPAEVSCWNSDQTSWNVCMNNGTWHHEFPDCKHSPIYSNPDTNGVNGCPIYHYDNKTMLIRKYNREAVYPPLRDVTVMFKCREGYQLLPYELSWQLITCQDNKQWLQNDINPRCDMKVHAVVALDPNNIYLDGSTIAMNCSVEGYPAPNVTWDKDGMFLHQNDRVQITAQPHRLVLRDVRTEDSGIYTCRASNTNMIASSQVKVKIQYIPSDCTDSPFFENCKLIVQGDFCSNPYYQNMCCRSCALAMSTNPNAL